MSNNKQQTAVEWLIDQLEEHIRKSAHNELGTIRTSDYRIGLRKAIDFCEQAKEMEKQEIIDAWEDNREYIFMNDEGGDLSKDTIHNLAVEYYNETFGGKL